MQQSGGPLTLLPIPVGEGALLNMGAQKIGRNEPCPCGSGLKFKRCCGTIVDNQRRSARVGPRQQWQLPREIYRALAEHEAKERARIAKYGEGRPQISFEHKGYRFVAVGSELHYSDKWKTFHDFLLYYIKKCIGIEWGNAELKKPYRERHILLRWYNDVCEYQRETIKVPGEVSEVVATGPVMAWLSLAYDLYTLRHHSLLQERLLERLRNQDQFQGARYEIYVAAAFVRAGFDLQTEDEDDPSVSHCEFTATHRATGLKYSVEAKSRHRPGLLGQPGEPQSWEKVQPDIGRLLRKALKKMANHERIVFIDINMPPQDAAGYDVSWFESLADVIGQMEGQQSEKEPLPSAFVFFTNHPYHYVGNEVPEPGRTFLFTGLNIPGFKPAKPEALGEYPAIGQLFDSVVNHTTIPHEFQ